MVEEILLAKPPKSSPLIRLLLRSYSSSSCCHKGRKGRDIFTLKGVGGGAAGACCFRKGKLDEPDFRADMMDQSERNKIRMRLNSSLPGRTGAGIVVETEEREDRG